MKIKLPKVIILEGCDKTGKSTLAKELSEKTGYKILHLGVPKGNWFEYLSELINANKKDGIIFDRFHWGDYVYAGITTDKKFLSPEQFVEIETKLAELRALVIYCHDGEKAITERFKADGEKLIAPENIAVILHKYMELLRSSGLNIAIHSFKHNPFKLDNYEQDNN